MCQRKGKVISLFDLNIVLSFEGRLSNTTDKDVKGEIVIPEVAYDSEESDYVFNVSGITQEKVREVVKKDIIPQLRKLLAQFGKDLIKEHGSGIQHPVDQVKSSFTRGNTLASQAEIAASTPATASNSTTTDSAASGTVPKYNTEPLVTTEVAFRAPASEIFQTFLDPARVSAWSRSTAVIKPEEGFNYTLFGGGVSGTITKLDSTKFSSIEMTWRLREWKQGHFAKFTLTFDQNQTDTTCKVAWTGIPIGEADVVLNNFEEYYVKPIKVTFGYGAVL